MSQKSFGFKHFISIIFQILIIFNNINQNSSDNEYLGDSSKHLFHFVQVTDIHITHVGYKDRIEQFEQFCTDVIKDLIQPKVTVVSGDLVNSVSSSTSGRERLLGTEQYEQEWQIYRNLLERTNVTKYTKWLDLKGNHDTFMDSNPDSSNSFYRIYSNQGHDHSGSYEYTIKTDDGDSYSFIAVDLCPRPGLGRPFNFFGYLSQNQRQILKNLSEKTKNSTSVIYFGHYPLSFSYSYGINHIMSKGLVYLNGHLHSGIKHLYARHSNGLLELELGDWKRKRRFRIITIDGGLLSFEDYRYGQSIYAVISNPKAAKFHTSREPFDRLIQSTHIRILIFSKFTIENVNISIDGKYLGSAIQSKDNRNLFVLSWNPNLYKDEKLHDISVEIKDSKNNRLKLNHEFSLSMKIITKWTRSMFILTFHQPTFGFLILIASLCLYVMILFYYRHSAKQKRFENNGRCSLWNRFRSQMTILCSIDFVYYSLIIFSIYHFIGPWYFGYLTEGHFGVVFLWGTFIKRVYLPPDTQTHVGTFQLYFMVFPLTYSLSSLCYYRYQQQMNSQRSRLRIYFVYILFLYVLSLTLLWSFLMTVSYKYAWILSPFGLILPIYFLSLFVKCYRFKVLLKTNQTDEVSFKLLDQQSLKTL